MKVYVVTEEHGEYEQRGWSVLATFTSEELAASYCEALKARPGDDYDYDILEQDVWDTPATTPVRTWCITIGVRKDMAEMREPYQVTEIVRAGTEPDLWHSTLTPNERAPDWADISVRAATKEEAKAEYARLAAEWTGGKTLLDSDRFLAALTARR